MTPTDATRDQAPDPRDTIAERMAAQLAAADRAYAKRAAATARLDATLTGRAA